MVVLSNACSIHLVTLLISKTLSADEIELGANEDASHIIGVKRNRDDWSVLILHFTCIFLAISHDVHFLIS